MVAPAAAVALDQGPAEPPPADFAGRQYIDSRGCVFLRDAEGTWTARRSRDGTAVCGYPPTLSARGAGGRPRLRALDPDAGKTRAQLLEERLARVVTGNLQAGELASDPRPLETLPDMGPEPAPVAPLDALKSALHAAPMVREEMSRDIEPNRRLCRLLGYDDEPAPQKEGLGHDPTQGYCGALPASDLSRLAFARPVGEIADATASAGTEPRPPRSRPHPPGSQACRPAARIAHRAGGRRRKAGTRTAGCREAGPPARPPAKVQGAEMIPATARYVQLGRFPDPAQAERAARRAAALGYPVLRGTGRDSATLLAGPFDTREAIVRALNRLRRAGFAAAVAR
ncbi:SPOR domain-containing protein [Paracoccus mutanolyticus]|uniref:SPOR domain-containing protein n=1 Tax=Paracoccus mutanolyticus TaxID=1499308 RepID=UPI001CB996A6|nr:SPOR domain-containing protein [Paracoccus mutanolyticus]